MNYKGYDIGQDNPYTAEWHATDPDADYDYDGIEGEHGGYFQCSGMPQHSASTLDDLKAEIDGYFAELAMDICFEACGIAGPEYMKFYGLTQTQNTH